MFAQVDSVAAGQTSAVRVVEWLANTLRVSMFRVSKTNACTVHCGAAVRSRKGGGGEEEKMYTPQLKVKCIMYNCPLLFCYSFSLAAIQSFHYQISACQYDIHHTSTKSQNNKLSFLTPKIVPNLYKLYCSHFKSYPSLHSFTCQYGNGNFNNVKYNN